MRLLFLILLLLNAAAFGYIRFAESRTGADNQIALLQIAPDKMKLLKPGAPRPERKDAASPQPGIPETLPKSVAQSPDQTEQLSGPGIPATLSKSKAANDLEGEILEANNAETCKKISGTTQAFVEGISGKYKISVRAVSFIRSQLSSDGSACLVVVDTPEGITNCMAGSVVVLSGKYLAHPLLKKDAGGYYNMGGVCGVYLR